MRSKCVAGNKAFNANIPRRIEVFSVGCTLWIVSMLANAAPTMHIKLESLLGRLIEMVQTKLGCSTKTVLRPQFM
jgi:hypothetical protein